MTRLGGGISIDNAGRITESPPNTRARSVVVVDGDKYLKEVVETFQDRRATVGRILSLRNQIVVIERAMAERIAPLQAELSALELLLEDMPEPPAKPTEPPDPGPGGQ